MKHLRVALSAAVELRRLFPASPTRGRQDPSALAAREKGVTLVNIAQVFQRSGMELSCRKDSGIKTPADFKGKRLGVWFSGNEYPFLAWMSKLGLKTDGSAGGVP